MSTLPPTSENFMVVRADIGPPAALGAMASAKINAGTSGSVDPKYCTAAGVDSDWKNMPMPQAAM